MTVATENRCSTIALKLLCSQEKNRVKLSLTSPIISSENKAKETLDIPIAMDSERLVADSRNLKIKITEGWVVRRGLSTLKGGNSRVYPYSYPSKGKGRVGF